MIRAFLSRLRADLLLWRPFQTAAVNLEFRKFHGRFPRLSPPETFNEKVTHRKLHDRDPRLPILSDKILVKEYVTELLGGQWIIPTYWYGERLPPRQDRRWPKPYVIKASHGCGWNMFVLSAEDEDWDRIERNTSRWLGRTYGMRGREWLYSKIKPGVIVEEFMGQSGVSPADYKFFVFGGSVKLIQVDLARFGRHRQFFYDRDWKRQNFTYVCDHDSGEIPTPVSLEKMIEAAEKLGADFPFVRIDLYEIDGHPYFGEFTFYPNSGSIEFKPSEVEMELGRAWLA